MKLTRDDKYVYLEGERVAVLTTGHAPPSVEAIFLNLIDDGLKEKVECDHDVEVVCKHCGHLTPTDEGDEQP